MNYETDYYKWWNPTQALPPKKVFKSDEIKRKAILKSSKGAKSNPSTDENIMLYGTETEIEQL